MTINRRETKSQLLPNISKRNWEDAKLLFYENEERGAAERHQVQLAMWEEDRERKQLEHDKRMELYNARCTYRFAIVEEET